MEALENNSFLENSSWNLSNIDIDSLNVSLTSQCVNVSEKSTTGNYTDNHHDLYEVPTVAVVVLSVFYGVICITAILGNLLVLCLVLVS